MSWALGAIGICSSVLIWVTGMLYNILDKVVELCHQVEEEVVIVSMVLL
jgi:hypothetical protein